MTEQTSSTIVVDADPREVMKVIADLEAYPEWTGSVRSVEVLDRDDTGRPKRARFVLDAGVVPASERANAYLVRSPTFF